MKIIFSSNSCWNIYNFRLNLLEELTRQGHTIYIIANIKSFTINEVAKMFKSKIRYLPKRDGERYSSALVNKNLSNTIYKYYGRISLKDYIRDFIKQHS